MSKPTDVNVITISVNNRKIDVNDGYINPVSGNAYHDYVRIILDEEWENLDKRITFSGSLKTKTVLWDGTEDVEIPWETITRPGKLGITIVGSENGIDRLITNSNNGQNETIRIIPRGAAEFVEPDTPTLDIYTQLVNAAERAEDIAEELEEKLESGYFNGDGVPEITEDDNGKILKVVNGKAEWVINTGGGGGGIDFEIGSGLKMEDGYLCVDVIEEVVEDNTQPITSGAIYKTVGNINALLEQI